MVDMPEQALSSEDSTYETLSNISKKQHALPPDSYTAKRLEHGTPEHLHITSRRTFIGPIPEGWLKSHRKQWYKQYFYLGASRRPSFRAEQPQVDGVVEPSVLDPRPEDEPRSTESITQQSTTISTSATTTSLTSLLHSQHNRTPLESPIIQPQTRSLQDSPDETVQDATAQTQQSTTSTTNRPQERSQATPQHQENTAPAPPKRVTFNESSKLQLRARAKRLASRTGLRSSMIKDGELLKMDKMLVQVDITQQQLPDFDERISQGVETKTISKWREYMVVCRKHTEEDANAVLQLHETRVIATTDKKKAKAQVLLSPRLARVNIFSSLDKTLCVWIGGARTTIYYLRPLSSATAVEWYTFLRSMMGWKRSQMLQISVPDLSVNLRLDDPFRREQVEEVLSKAADGDDAALVKALSDESGAAGSIVARCMEMLKGSQEWADVFKVWESYGHIGLAWKRYDRLEWVHGAIEQKMYGTVAMAKTHDLELRPKEHYSTCTKGEQEPIPVEGFLIRLTSQKGQLHGKMMFKRLYFTSQNQYLIFMRPSRAKPPPPPKRRSTVPSTKQIAQEIPMIYDIDPYPLHDGKVSWLEKDALQYDQAAAAEADRQVNMLLACDGFIDMRDIKLIRPMQRGAMEADDNVEEGDNVDFDISVPDHAGEDGQAEEIEEDRILELVLKNNLIIRLQAFSKSMRLQWMKRLQALVAYWKERTREDMNMYKSVREQNLSTLGIDERAEAVVGQFAYKWEVSQSFASPKMYNVCGISRCRTIHMSGLLFRKPRRHTTFIRCQVILSHGHILIFEDSLRKRTGEKVVQIHHERISSIDLTGCYLYSGMLTENDLLYQNRTFDSNMPGHHALSRIYLEDGWTSTDEDSMTTFVIWHSKTKSWFKSSSSVDDVKDARKVAEGTKLKRVSKLGTTGRSVVFKARSRAERDHWVLAIQNEIERLSTVMTEDVRLEMVE